MKISNTEIDLRFLANVMHEIRTPVQTIISTIELLGDSPLTAEQTEYLHQIEFSADILLHLSNDILDFSKLSSNEFKLESIPFDIIELTEHVVDLISVESFNKGLELVTELDYTMPRMVLGDPTRIQQVLLNITKNAIKFTEKGYIKIRLGQSEGFIVCSIEDSGIGIPLEKQQYIFEDFFQADKSFTREYSGAGMGLSISRHIVESMGGKISISSLPKQGTTFSFTVPLIPSELETKSLNIAIPPQTKILLVDKNPLMLESGCRKMEALGIQLFDTADNSSDAYQKLVLASKTKEPFTMALICKDMPKVDGCQLASAIKRNASLQGIRIILCVSEGQLGPEEILNEHSKIDGYLHKPVKLSRLLSLFAAQEKSRPEEKKPPQEHNGSRSRNILIAEDHPVNRKLLSMCLEKTGATIYLAEDGEQAERQVAEHPDIDIIFMDIFMPKKNGIDATTAIRSRGYKGIIIACTANSNEEDFASYRQIGMNDILIKPFKRGDIDTLLDKWDSVLAYPQAKSVLSLTSMYNKMMSIWDINALMETAGGNSMFAKSLMEDYIAQCQKIMAHIKLVLENPKRDFRKLELYTNTLKVKSSEMSVHKLAEYAEKMEDAIQQRDMIKLEAARTDFAIIFLKLKLSIKTWETSL